MSGPVLLVVDSAPQTGERASLAVEGTGLAVRHARDAEEAEARLENDEVVAVLTSVRFPGGNGYDLARQVRLRHPGAAVFLLCGGFDVYNADRATEAGVTARVNRPFSGAALRAQLEAALGAFPTDGLPSIEGMEALGEPEVTPPAPLFAPPALDAALPVPAVGDERMATFLPRDWRSTPAVLVDPTVVAPAMERAILAVLPEVVDVVINKAIATSPAFREMLEAAVEQAVKEQLPLVARRVVQEHIAAMEARARRDEQG